MPGRSLPPWYLCDMFGKNCSPRGRTSKRLRACLLCAFYDGLHTMNTESAPSARILLNLSIFIAHLMEGLLCSLQVLNTSVNMGTTVACFCLQDYMFEECVCLLLRATWFKPLVVVHQDEPYDEFADVYQYVYGEEYVDVAEYDDDLEDAYFNNSASLRIGNRRWGDNGFVRSGRREARPVHRSSIHDTAGVGSSSEPINNNKKEAGSRAKRALKREAADKAAADKAAAAKHQELLVRMGRK